MNYNEALTFIHSVSNYFCKPGLDRIKKLTRQLGNPQDDLKFIHIAGTNGKGSLCAFLSEIFKTNGKKVGVYTSPYILRFNERISINGIPISNEDLARICSIVKDFCEQMEDKPTEFEIITAIAFKYFKEQNCDLVILECGLGGRLDATNIIKSPLLSIITGIDFDHQNFLGNTIELIAKEKAGIIKEKCPILWCGENTEAKEIIEKEAREKNCEFYINDAPISINKYDFLGTEFSFKEYKNLNISLLGSYQPKNASNAISAIEILNKNGMNISNSDIETGLKNAKWPARFELLSKKPLIIFDGSHNPEGVTAAVNSIKRYFGNKKVNIISGVMRDKDYSFIAKSIAEIANTVHCVTVDNPRSLSSQEYAETFKSNNINAKGYDSVKEALTCALEDKDTPLVCLGSLYLYGEIYNILKG